MLLKVEHLCTDFLIKRGVINVVRDVSFQLDTGQIFALVGESGSGKSVTGLSIMGLLSDTGRVSAGSISFDGKNLGKLKKSEYRNLRGNDMAMIFQEPMTSLNPVYRVGDQIIEAIRAHTNMSKKQAREHAVEMLRRVGIPSPEQRIRDYPHQMSGGMRQRVMIAMALACNPKLLIADEPTTALDVTIQAQILDLIRRLNVETNMAVMLITHDLGVVSEVADYVAVMYCGQLVESAPVRVLFDNPLHPYTLGLMKSVPSLDEDDSAEHLYMIRGSVPDLMDLPRGCAFSERCDQCFDRCFEEAPELVDFAGHQVRCLLYDGEAAVSPEGEAALSPKGEGDLSPEGVV